MTLKQWVHEPLILGNDQPFFKGQKETPGSHFATNPNWNETSYLSPQVLNLRGAEVGGFPLLVSKRVGPPKKDTPIMFR